jgi:P-type conjugative transfer protein TrbJ
MRSRVIRTLLAGVAAAYLAATAGEAQLFGGGGIVYDPANHAENILSAVRALQEVQQQIQQLQNEAAMLVNQARNLEGLGITAAPELQAAVVRIRALIDRAEGIAFEIAATEEAWARDYPESYAALDHDAMVANARLQWANARSALGTALAMQAETVALAEGDAETLARLLAESSGASGNLDATQATNELIGLDVAQGLRTQQLLAAQARAQALDQARALEAAEAARVRRERFLGDGSAYEPES